jgi:transposase InsO family protein
LAVFDPAKPVAVHTDASNTAIGAVLMQGEQPIAYESRKLTGAEKNYPVHEKEQLAIIHAVTKWRHYLHSTKEPFTIFTDHRSLRFLDTQPNLSGRQARWAEKMAEYNYTIEYKKGSMNIVPDALSRIPEHFINVISESRYMVGEDVLHQIRQALPDDPVFGQVYQFTLDEPEDSDFGYEVRDGLLYLKAGDRICIPDVPEVKSILLQEMHDSPTSGHYGVDKTYARLARVCFWPKMTGSVQRYVESCHTCKVTKTRTAKEYGLLRPLPVPERPWQHITMDLVVKLPKTMTGYDAIAVFVDRLSKAAVFAPTTSNGRATDMAELFFEYVHCRYGMPQSIVSDRDPRFTSQFWQKLFEKLGTRLRLATAYHQQTDGQSERTIQTLKRYLKTYAAKDPHNWDQMMHHAEFAHNSTKSSATGLSPFQVLYGWQPSTPLDQMFGTFEECSTSAPSVQETLEWHAERFQQVRDALQDAHIQMTRQYNQNHRDVRFQKGDLVYLESRHLRSLCAEAGSTFKSPYLGPYKIREKLPNDNYALDFPSGSQVFGSFHVSKLRKHIERDLIEFPDSEPPEQDNDPIVPDKEDSGYYQEEYEVEHIVRHTKRPNGKYRFLVKWKGYPHSQNTWQTYEDLENARDVLDDYLAGISETLHL